MKCENCGKDTPKNLEYCPTCKIEEKTKKWDITLYYFLISVAVILAQIFMINLLSSDTILDFPHF